MKKIVASAVAVVALATGVVGFTAGDAHAMRDTGWGGCCN